MRKSPYYLLICLLSFVLCLSACGEDTHTIPDTESSDPDQSDTNEPQGTGDEQTDSQSDDSVDDGEDPQDPNDAADTSGTDPEDNTDTNSNPDPDTTTEPDEGDGTETTTDASGCSGSFDATTNLCWQDPTYFGSTNNGINWADAVVYCNALEQDGANGWYMPNVDEVRTIIKGCASTETGGSCTIVDGSPDTMYSEACDGCALFGGPADSCYWPDAFNGLCPASMWLWTSSESVDPGFPFFFDPSAGRLGRTFDTLSMGVRCVRQVP